MCYLFFSFEHQGKNCPNLDCRTKGFVLKEDAYLKPGDALDEGNHLTIKFLKVKFTCQVKQTNLNRISLNQFAFFS
jgi:ribosomal 50S subunit-recycling heat shock protein